MKLLIDEMLSPTLVERLGEIGVAAEHVVYTGRSAHSDADLWRDGFDHDQTVVTINAEDFLTLAGRSPIHAGLIVIRQSGLTREEQWEILRPVIENLKNEDLLNKVVEIYADGSFKVRDLPKP